MTIECDAFAASLRFSEFVIGHYDSVHYVSKREEVKEDE